MIFEKPIKNSLEVIMNDKKETFRNSTKNIRSESNFPNYKKWKLNSGSKNKSSTSAKSMWKRNKRNGKKDHFENLKRTFALNSNNKKSNIEFDYTFKKGKPIIETLKDKIPKEMQVMVKNSTGKIVQGINIQVPKPKPKLKIKKKKNLQFWKIGDVIIYRRNNRDLKNKNNRYIPIKYDVYESKDEINQFKKANDIHF